ncbi:membrane-associated progesterone receptor component 1 [Bactrocera neohumeralis]|uniref:membrane-associated progesterone receptor component 1 n=1 Tax=Bactrocera tryoni TaxID=59916 RepID=UPI001A9919DB|nr:membrane-associated progesterone receptor component 1 [Bactrocera tryoni]XP_050331645.1 membrane-associated progesterone receptor component 1 [Bactrocera neohumeralis]
MTVSAGAADSNSNVAGNESSSILLGIVEEIIYSPLNLALVAVIVFLFYKIVKDRYEVPRDRSGEGTSQIPELPKLRRDFTIQELRAYDGNGPDGRILIAVNGTVYDATKAKRFYGPGGPYASFAGRDASRNLATFNVEPNNKEEYDDLSDLNAMEMDSVREWEMQFKEKYDLVGKLLRKGEQPTNYDDEEEDSNEVVTEVNANSSVPTTNASNNDDGVRKRVANSTDEEVK